MDPAPFFDSDTDAACAHWVMGGGGVCLRAARLGIGECGTVLCFQGRTEYAEKYGQVAAVLTAGGLGSVTIDWRGQGLADRPGGNPMLGHVDHFDDYQQDVVALVAYAEAMKMPRPWYMLAHSMGGAIALRALHNGLDVIAASFSAPMWGLTITPPMRPLAHALPFLAEQVGLSQMKVPGTSATPYVLDAAPDDNLLTSDPEAFAWFRDHVRRHPELGLGGPTMQWLLESMREFNRMRQDPPPPVPCQVHVGNNERIVSPAAIRHFVGLWANTSLTKYPGGEHELLMERPAIRDAVLSASLAFFETAANG